MNDENGVQGKNEDVLAEVDETTDAQTGEDVDTGAETFWAGDYTGLDASEDATEDEDADEDVAEDGREETEMVPDTEKDNDNKDKNKRAMELYDWLQCIVIAVIGGILIFVFIGRRVAVEGDSMLPTLHWYDMIVVSDLFYTPKNKDIVVFKPPSESFNGTPLVKRVIAISGQTLDIDFDSGEVYVDGIVIDEPYINEITNRRLDFSGPVTVPEGYVFVMGDNRNHSADSRDSRIGFVDTRCILGKVLFLMIPGGNNNESRDWSRFGLVSG